MGVSLSYTSTPDINRDQRSSILSEAREVNGRRQWWCESINFFDDPNNPNRLSGDTKVFLTGYTADDGSYVEVDPTHDTIMALRDISVIVDSLRRWSEQYGVSWQLVMEGQNAGAISDGQIDPDVEVFLDGMREMAVALGAVDVSDAEIEAIEQQYSSRHDPVDSSGSGSAANPEPAQKEAGKKRKWWKFWV